MTSRANLRASRTADAVCSTCRQRKIKCDRRRPTCGFCSQGHLPCHYQVARQTPGLRAGYVSQLEGRIASLEQEFQDFKAQAPWTAPQTQPAALEILPETELDPLSPAKLREYCDTWFSKYHSWFPILHEPTILQSFTETPISLVIKAIALAVTPGSSQLASLEDVILLTAIHNLSVQSLQALLILTIPVFGSGRMSEFYNIIALCKSTQLGLRDLVNYQCANFASTSSPIPPRMLHIPVTAVEREEKTRAFWATEALDSTSTLGAAWHLSLSRPEPAATIPCDEEIWRYPESMLAIFQFGDSEAPSSFSLFVSLATSELWHMHHFLQQSYVAADNRQRQKDCDAVYSRLKAWEADFARVLAAQSPPFADLFDAGNDQHPNSILIRCTIHSAVISLYQRSVSAESGQYDKNAAGRCLASCLAMVDVVHGIDDALLRTINPHVIFCIFIAARFYAVYSVEEAVYPLIHALEVAGKTWPLAKQLKAVLDATIEGSGHELPIEFYDLQYLSWDIHDALRKWALAKDPSLARPGLTA